MSPTHALTQDLRVVLVDDHACLRQALCRLLDREDGISVVGSAGDGPTALEMVASTRPDVVVTDVDMPHMSGLELLPALRVVVPGAAVILHSADDSHEHAAFAGGADAFAVKGDFDELIDKIRAGRQA